eukprot:gene6034-9139_t
MECLLCKKTFQTKSAIVTHQRRSRRHQQLLEKENECLKKTNTSDLIKENWKIKTNLFSSSTNQSECTPQYQAATPNNFHENDKSQRHSSPQVDATVAASPNNMSNDYQDELCAMFDDPKPDKRTFSSVEDNSSEKLEEWLLSPDLFC